MSTQAVKLDIKIKQGEDWSLRLQWADEAGVPVFVQAPCFMDIRTKSDETSPRVARISTAGGADGTITIGSSPNYYIDLALPRAKTAAIVASVYYYDLFVTDSLGFRHPLVSGRVEVIQRISLETV